jgi:hypothetical protein
MKLRSTLFPLFITLLVLTPLAPDADARGRGGSSFSRGGVASGGAFSDRASAPREQREVQQVNRQANPGEHQDDRQEWEDDNREDWQEHTEERQEDRKDFVEDEHDDDWDHHHNDWDDNDGELAAGVIIGATIVGAAAAASSSTKTQVTYVTTLPCEATAVSDEGVSYYKCSSTWYQRGYAGSQVTYIQVPAPPGF